MKESNTQKALKGMSSQTLVTIMLGVVNIVSFSIMSRLLSQEDFGRYAALMAITTVFASFSETGIGSSIVQKKRLTKQFIDNAFTLSLIFGCAISILMFATAPLVSNFFSDNTLKVPIMLMSITLLCHCLTSVNISIMQRKLQFLRIGFVNLISQLITMAVAIILAHKGFGYYAIITSVILGSVLLFFISYFGVGSIYSLTLDKTTSKTILNFSGWLMISVFFRNLANQIDRLLMTRYLSVDLLGEYNRPKEFISQMSNRLNGIFDSALFPVLSGIQDNLERIKRAYLRSLYYMNIFAIVITMYFFFNGELIIRIFFGAKWISILPVFQILSCSLLFHIDARLADCFFRSLGWTKQQFYFRIFEVLAQFLGLIVCAKYGIIGIATSVVLVRFVVIWVKNIYITKRINLSVLESVKMILRSWKIGYTIIPVMLVCMHIMPHTITGEILNAIIISTLLLVSFICFPVIVGNQYKDDAYIAIKRLICKKLHIKNRNIL